MSKPQMKRRLFVALVALATSGSAMAQTDWPFLKLTALINQATDTTHITHAADGSRRLFVVGQAGQIRVVQSNAFLSVPFLDIVDRVKSGSEQGLLSMAFPPGSGARDHFYVNYTRKPDGATIVSRFRVDTDPNRAVPISEQILLTIPQPTGIHNGGQIAFGPDQFLYVGMGDGGSGTPAQVSSSFLGKLLRVDVQSVTTGYAIPSNNPFVASTNHLPEIWAIGLRNPWRFSFDRVTGDLYIGDVGASSREEIDFQPVNSPGGENYGWPIKEGSLGTNYPQGLDPNQLTSPIF
jgi:glucose/arabinose dehydrogenase